MCVYFIISLTSDEHFRCWLHIVVRPCCQTYHAVVTFNSRECFYGILFQGKEFETRLKEKKPGNLSDDLRTALGMPIGAVSIMC